MSAGNHNHRGADTCPRCGADRQAVRNAVQVIARMNGAKKCDKCGAILCKTCKGGFAPVRRTQQFCRSRKDYCRWLAYCKRQGQPFAARRKRYFQNRAKAIKTAKTAKAA